MRPRTRRILRRTSVRFIASCRHVRMPSACSRRIMRSNTSRIFRRCNRFILKFVAHNAKRMWTARSDASPSSRSARLHASVSCIVRTAAACCATMTAAMWVSQRRHAANSSVRRSRPRTLIAIDAARAWARAVLAKPSQVRIARNSTACAHLLQSRSHLRDARQESVQVTHPDRRKRHSTWQSVKSARFAAAARRVSATRAAFVDTFHACKLRHSFMYSRRRMALSGS